MTVRMGLPRVWLPLYVWASPCGKMDAVPKKFPAEFKRDVVTVARLGDLTRGEVAADFGISEQTVIRWMQQADIDDGIKDGLTTAEQSERLNHLATSAISASLAPGVCSADMNPEAPSRVPERMGAGGDDGPDFPRGVHQSKLVSRA